MIVEPGCFSRNASASRAVMKSPGMNSPAPSMKKQRSASPSQAMPMSVAIDRDGKSVWATDRCSPGATPGCLGTKANPVHKFDESGKEIRSFGGGMFVWPHGIHVDRDGNVWVADARAPSPDQLKKFRGEQAKGSVVVKFSPEGKV